MRAFLSNVRRRGASALVATLVSVGASMGALAQSDGEDEAAQVRPASEDPQSTTGQLAAAERAVANGHALETTLTQRLEAASGRSDIVMIDCLTPLRTQLEATLASADSRLRALRLLARGGDEAAAHHEYTMVMVAAQRFAIVESDMNQCLGDADIATGDDRVTVEVTIDLPDEDPTAPSPAVPNVPVPYVPPPLSPAF